MIGTQLSPEIAMVGGQLSDNAVRLSSPVVEPKSPPTPTKPNVPAEPIKIPRPVPLEPKTPARKTPYIEPAPRPKKEPTPMPIPSPEKKPPPRLVPDCFFSPLVLPPRVL